MRFPEELQDSREGWGGGNLRVTEVSSLGYSIGEEGVGVGTRTSQKRREGGSQAGQSQGSDPRGPCRIL